MTTLRNKISDLAFEVEGMLERMSDTQQSLVNLMQSDIPENHEIAEAELRGAMWVIQRLMPGRSFSEKTCRSMAKEICDYARVQELYSDDNEEAPSKRF